MEKMRESWTDERLDDFRGDVNRRFDRVEAELGRINDRLDGLQRTMIHGAIAMTASILAGNAALITLVVTQL
jgi:hypothetical protein